MKESKQEKLRMLLQMEVEAAIDNALNKFHLEQINEATKELKIEDMQVVKLNQ